MASRMGPVPARRGRQYRRGGPTGPVSRGWGWRLGRFFLKSALVGILAVIAAVLGRIGLEVLEEASLLPLARLEVKGIRHLTQRDVLRLTRLGRGQSLLFVDLQQAMEGLGRSPWVKGAVIRRIFPDRVMCVVQEREPVALLHPARRPSGRKKGYFLIGEDAFVLATTDSEAGKGLPLISGVRGPRPRVGQKLISRDLGPALELVAALREDQEILRYGTVEIWSSDRGNPVLFINGLEVRVGQGNYREKFARYHAVEEDIRQRVASVAYVDLRFKNEVVVKTQ